jgi:hypothetical protein
VQHFATEWMWQYNHERPNMGLGGSGSWPQHSLYFCVALKAGGLPPVLLLVFLGPQGGIGQCPSRIRG